MTAPATRAAIPRGGLLDLERAGDATVRALEETLDVLSDPKAMMKAIRSAGAEVDAGKGVRGDDLRATYLDR